ncbi:MAG: response regulator [Parabacteroides sp.]|nr:response regulator [Parabacteroides sp.]
MIVVYSAGLTIIDVINPLDNVLFGLESADLVGKDIPGLMREYPSFREAGGQILEQLRQTLRTKTITATNYTVRTRKGVAHVHLRATPFEADKLLTFVHNITDRVNNEREVLKLKSFLQSVIDNLPVPVFVKEVANDFRYIYYNDKCLDFYADSVKESKHENNAETARLESLYREEDIKVLETGKPMSFERIIYNERNEPYRWGITTKTRLQNSDGSYYIIAVLMETTELRKKQMEMDTIRKELSLALDAGSLSAWIYDVNSRIFTSLYGETVSKAGLDYEEIEAIAHPDDRAKYKRFMEVLAAGKVKKQKEIFRFYGENGYSWFETHAIGLCSAETGAIDCIVGTQKDITQDIEAEEKAKADKIKSDLAIQSSGIMQWDYDVRSCTFTSPNDESFIYNRDVPKEDYFSFICPEDVHLYETGLDKIIRGESRTAHFQLRQNRPPIGLRWAEIHCVACEYDEAGNVVKITGLWRDITEMKKLIDELAAKEKAEELNRLKSAFLANMSHEIRTPLNAIVGFSQLMAQTDDPQEKAEFNKIIETNNELLLQLINDILDLSKIEVGQLDFVFTEVDVIRLMVNLEAIYRYKLKDGVKLVCSFPDRACVVYSEKNRLTQVVSNFLSNACKFTSSGAIRMGYEHIPGGLRFYVSDTGKGIKKENLPHVFERFAKFDSFIQGTGLGLSICQTIVQHLQGEIGVDSEPGKGSTFWFTVPCEIRSVQAAAPLVAEPVVAIQTAVPDREYTVLVAEDNDSNYLLISRILDKHYNLVRAVNGKEAVTLFSQVHPDLVLMDIKMPEMNGIMATQAIRRMDSQVGIIALTAHAFDQDKEEALKAGCNGFLTKPVHIPELKEMIRKFLP